MKILLLTQPLLKKEIYGKFGIIAPSLPPLGLGYIAAVLLKAGFKVKIIDCCAENINFLRLKREIICYSPEIIGVSATTIAYSSAKQAFCLIKEINKNIITILGGPHISALPLDTMQDCKELDIGVIGEGENTILDIVNSLREKSSLKNIDGIVYRNGREAVINKTRQPIENLDILPFPARHLLNNHTIYYHTPYRGGRNIQTMITSRGCHFDCSYCDQSVFGKRWRAHSAGYVVSEMEFILKNSKSNFISIEDDNFLVSKERVLAIANSIIKKSIDVRWGCSVRLESVDSDLLSLMSKAGCKVIYVGIESGSPRIKRLLNRNIDDGLIKSRVKIIKKANIAVYGSFMIGIPTETKEDIEETIRFALALPLNGVSFFIYVPFPNTPLRDFALTHGKVDNDFITYSTHSSCLPFVPDGLNEKYILKTQRRAYIKFLLSPKRLISNLKTLTDSRLIPNLFQILHKNI